MCVCVCERERERQLVCVPSLNYCGDVLIEIGCRKISISLVFVSPHLATNNPSPHTTSNYKGCFLFVTGGLAAEPWPTAHIPPALRWPRRQLRVDSWPKETNQ